MDGQMIYRCYGMMDSRGRWRTWRFGPATPEVENQLTTEVDITGHVLFASVQRFAAPADTVGITRWRQVREQYVGENARPHRAPLYFDVDCNGDLEKALLWARTLVEFFVHQLDLPESAVRVWFSGSKGAHILVDPIALGIEPSATLTADMKTVALELVRHLVAQGANDMTIDRAVYSLPRMLCMPDQRNPRSGLYKVELRHSELFQLTADQVMSLARKPRGSLWSAKDFPCEPVSAPVELTVERLRNFIENLCVLRAAISGEEEASVAWLTRRLNKPVDGNQALLALTDIFRRAAEDVLRACATAGHGQWKYSEAVLDQIITGYDKELLDNEKAFVGLLKEAYHAARRKTALPNILEDLRELLQTSRLVHLSIGACRWIRRSYLPPNRQILMLDATAEASVVAGVTGRKVEVIETPLIEQKATIYQIMDKIGTRAGNRRDLQREESWTRKLVTEVARRHRNQSLLCITFKADEEEIQKILDAEHGSATVIHYGALRGLNAFEKFEVGLILGRPMPNEAQLQLLAVSAFGRDALDQDLQPPPLEWQLHTHEIGPDIWQIRRQQYSDERWQAVWRHVVTGELQQAIGRLRPLTNPATIYVACNEPLPNTLDIVPVYASELFPDMSTSTRRSDFRDRVRQYTQTMENLVAEGTEPSNKTVCERMGIKPPNGIRYRKLATQADARAPP